MQDWRVATFLSACETLNYTHTAAELHITQPAVSQHIAWLESCLGTKLFERHGRLLSLTPAGKLARRALTAERRNGTLLLQEIRKLDQGAQSVRIGATLTAGEYLLAAPLGRWIADNPAATVHVVSADTAQLLEAIDRGKVDCALIEGIFDKERYANRAWSTEQLVCVASPDSAAAGKASGGRPLRFSDLLEETLIVRERGSGTRAVLEASLMHRNLSAESFARTVVAHSLNVACELAAANAGVTFVYEPVAARFVADGRLQALPLAETGLDHAITFIWPKDTPFEQSFSRLFDELCALR